jgi:hypothetical protein
MRGLREKHILREAPDAGVVEAAASNLQHK